jgi:hypothetical protein
VQLRKKWKGTTKFISPHSKKKIELLNLHISGRAPQKYILQKLANERQRSKCK